MGYKQYLSRGFPTLPSFPEVPPIQESDCAHSSGADATRVAQEAAMFEVAQEQKQASSNRMLVSIVVVVAAGTAWYKFRITGATPMAQ
jgi:hypothetical protein